MGMKPLRIGQAVRVNAITTLEYDENNNRHIEKHNCEPFDAVIIGVRVKQTGKYSRGTKYFPMDGMYEYDPPYLHVTGAVKLWECRHGMENKPFLVADEDLEITNDFILPRISPLPK